MSRQDKFELPKIPTVPSEPTLEDVDQIKVDLRLKLAEITEMEAELLRRSARRAPTQNELVCLAKKIYDARCKRERMLDKEKSGLFGEPAWDMLLALYYMPKRGEILTASGLAYASCVPNTTALRWQAVLVRDGLMEIGPHVKDKRLKLVRLTPRGRALMDTYLTRLFYSDAPLPAKSE